jgi:L-malate glycosyltransferase
VLHLSSEIKVLHIIKSLGRGGAEMLLPETLKLHDQGKFEFQYIYFLPWKNQMVSAIEQAGGKVTCLEASNTLQIISKTHAIVRYCRENQIQLIHCHLPWAGMVGRLVHRKTGIPGCVH